jgi:hypothetical protein
MSGGFDPRDHDTREQDDGVLDREEHWLAIGRASNSQHVGDESLEPDVYQREDRDRESRDREEDHGADDPRDAFVRDLDLPLKAERELCITAIATTA